jgi:hypothetical protein
MKQFKIRASGAGNIMGVKGLGKTGHSFLQQWVKEQLYGRKKFMTNKYVEKGLIMEDEAIDFIADELGYGFLVKNEQFFRNDYFTGTPDIILDDHIIDVKNSYDCFTFPLFEDNILNKDYIYQAQIYMELVGRDNYKLIYTLMDNPEHQIKKDFKWNNPNQLDYEDFKKDFVYSDLESNLRIKVFEIKRDEEILDKLKERVLESRNYIKQLLNK